MISRRVTLTLSTIAAVAAPLMGTANASAPAQHAGNGRVFTYADSGRTIKVASGATFRVKLYACTDCGSYWHFAQRPAARLVKVVRRSDARTAQPPAVGGGTVSTWTFKATNNPGPTSMRLVETSAENGGKVIKTFTLKVDVHKVVIDD